MLRCRARVGSFATTLVFAAAMIARCGCLPSASSSSINEQANSELPNLSHTLHTINAIKRFPNFLSRHPVSQLDKLESDVSCYLEFLKNAKKRAKDRAKEFERLRDAYDASHYEKTRYSHLFDNVESSPSFGDLRRALSPACRKLLDKYKPDSANMNKPYVEWLKDQVTIVHSQKDLDDIIERLPLSTHPVYTVQLFSRSFCNALLNHVRCYRKYLAELPVKSSALPCSAEGLSTQALKNIDLRWIPGARWVGEFLFLFFTKPLAAELYSDVGRNLDWFQSYSAGYEKGGRDGLLCHTDDW